MAHAGNNPAAVFCGQLGGTESNIDLKNKSLPALCSFSGGGEVEQWTLFNDMNSKKKTEALEVFRKHPEVSKTLILKHFEKNSYCDAVGGEKVLDLIQEGDGYGLCKFKDGSEIALTILYKGPKDTANAALVAALNSGKKYVAPKEKKRKGNEMPPLTAPARKQAL